MNTISADLRAPAVDVHRFHTRGAKYDSFQHVNAGQVGAPHYEATSQRIMSFNVFPANLAEAKVSTLKKRDLWEEARWAGPPKHHRSNHKDKLGNTSKYARRRKEQRLLRAGPRPEETGSEEDPEALAEKDLRDEEMRRVEKRDYDGEGEGEKAERDGRNKDKDYTVLIDRAHQGWEKKRMKVAERAGWDLVSDFASVCSDEMEKERDKDGYDSDYELV